ncbi:MAG: hypothetical protein A2506_11405 [Elusimicrobia bacterium RIFOXYD12_FULL_66_9]|nr:MAG: hypothetical protein A2506_11405 [Elusimicrobia bacterium RIFOXYD12_FULL_66_9]
MAYYVYDGKAAVGPFEPADLVKRPGFDAGTLVFPVGASTADAWKPASAFPDLASALKPPEPPPAPAEPEPLPTPTAEAPPEFASPADKLMMVVDDDDGVRSLIEMSATMQGFQVVTAVNGHDATAKLAERPADLIVTDLMMPGQGGYEFLRALQAAGGPRVPVFVVTGSTLDESTVKMIRQEANVVEFFAKPLRIPALVAALHKHLKTAPR